MSKTIHIVTSGEYDDYVIHGVYDTPAKASLVSDHILDSSIEVWTLNGGYNSLVKGYKAYQSEISEDGVLYVSETGFIAKEETSLYLALRWRGNARIIALCWNGYAKNDEHAKKIAKRLYRKVLKTTEWGIPEGSDFTDLSSLLST